MKEVIDLSICEPFNIKNALCDVLSLNKISININSASRYPNKIGNKNLVDHLENVHNAPVIITNGAKQGLAAAFSCLRHFGKSKLGLRTPYWCGIPPIANHFNLKLSKNYDCFLSVMPNNPDNFYFDNDYFDYLSSYHHWLKIPFIHDAAFYSPIYMPEGYKIKNIGDVQIFSISKTLGLSGLRIGYVVCNNRNYYKHIKEYIENTTLGASSISQDMVYQILSELGSDIKKSNKFIERVRNDLKLSRIICNMIRREILELPTNFINHIGSFAWGKVKDKSIFNNANVKVGIGELYGTDSYIRINLTSPHIDLLDAVKKLNQCLKV